MIRYEVPLSPTPQSFRIALAGVVYRLTLRWLAVQDGGWVLDIADAQDVPLLQGVPLVTGADLLAQHRHLGFGGALVVRTDGDAGAMPTFDNLGVGSRVYFVTQ